jgi:hypothetical protein
MGDAKFWIEIVAALTMPVGIIAVVAHRIKQKIGMGVRSIQFLALTIIFPMVLILALENKLEDSAIGALIGALLGYLFSNIGKYDERKAGKYDA